MAEEEGTILKPPAFDGSEEQWQEWSFVMRAYIAGKLERGQGLMNLAEDIVGSNDVSSTRFTASGNAQLQQDNRRLFYLLVMTVKGPAQMILRSQEPANGTARWRALCRRCEPATAVRAQSIMQSLLNVEREHVPE